MKKPKQQLLARQQKRSRRCLPLLLGLVTTALLAHNFNFNSELSNPANKRNQKQIRRPQPSISNTTNAYPQQILHPPIEDVISTPKLTPTPSPTREITKTQIGTNESLANNNEVAGTIVQENTLARQAVVFCGAHQASSCAECPRGDDGNLWCNGDCEWSYETNTCIRGPRYISDEYEALLNLGLAPFQPIRDEHGRLINIMLIRQPLHTWVDRLAFDQYKEKVLFLGIMSYENFPLPSPNPFSNISKFYDTNFYVGNPWIKGWLNMYRNPRNIFGQNSTIIQISQSDFNLPEIDFEREVEAGEHEKRYDFVYAMSNLGMLNNKTCTGWGAEAKNWTFAKEALKVMCGDELNLTGVLLATRSTWDTKPCEIPKSCEGKILQTPFVNYQEAFSYFRQSRFLFVPQVNDASPRVVTQAMALNVPVLMNNNIVGGWKYINNQTGEFFHDMTDFKEAYWRLKAGMGRYKPREYITQNYGNRNTGKRFLDFVKEHFSDRVQIPEGTTMLLPSS